MKKEIRRGFQTRQRNSSELSKSKDVSTHLALTRGSISALERISDGLNKDPSDYKLDSYSILDSKFVKRVDKIGKNKI